MPGVLEAIHKQAAIVDDPAEREKADYKSPLTYFIMAVLLGCTNILLLFEPTRNHFYVGIMIWNLAVIFILSATIGQLRFK